ncbi:RraA family protein [Halobacterium sp. KA-4]|uniref:RraA family protein n=1 Tax=Halobacterium sp. KA-4 TaxID=2896367 RepID=UPI001E574750|nr:RraA family protein [Halobacterium sp. KA-4]MCD2201189.1 RraA family protein [Halobacterium sp. KA-4]
MTKAIEPVDSTVLDRLERCSTAAIADTKHEDVTVMATGIEPVSIDGAVAGPVRTVTLDPTALSAPVQTLDAAHEDELIVVDAGSTAEAVWGELLSTYAEEVGVRGLVTNGAVRDVGEVRDLGFPIFAGGVTPRGPSSNEEAAQNEQVTVGGALVAPGDVVVGDDTGVVVIEHDVVEEVAAAAEAIAETEREVERLIGERRSLEEAFEVAGL